MTESKTHSIQSGEAIIHCLEYMPSIKPNGITLLFLHGTNQTLHTWDDLIAKLLPEGFHIFAYDHLGHGDTTWAKKDSDYSLSNMSNDLHNVIIHLNLDLSKTCIIGMSLGGLISMQYVSSLKKPLLGLVIVDITPTVNRRDLSSLKQSVVDSMVLDSFEDFVVWAKTFNPTRSLENLTERLKWSLHQVNGKWTWKHDPKFITFVRHDEMESMWDEIKGIKCKTLTIRGSESKITTREQIEKLVSFIDGSTWIEVEKAGHSVQGDNPDGLKSALLNFIQA